MVDMDPRGKLVTSIFGRTWNLGMCAFDSDMEYSDSDSESDSDSSSDEGSLQEIYLTFLINLLLKRTRKKMKSEKTEIVLSIYLCKIQDQLNFDL